MKERSHAIVWFATLPIPKKVISKAIWHKFIKERTKELFNCELSDSSRSHKSNLKNHIITIHEGQRPLNVNFVTKMLTQQ